MWCFLVLICLDFLEGGASANINFKKDVIFLSIVTNKLQTDLAVIDITHECHVETCTLCYLNLKPVQLSN